MKKFLFTFIIVFSGLFFVGNNFVQSVDLKAQVVKEFRTGAISAGMGGAIAPQSTIMGLITIMLSVTGMIFLALVFYGGYLYVASRGDEEQAKKAMNIIKASIIGLAIVLFSYGITLFIGSRVTGENIPIYEAPPPGL